MSSNRQNTLNVDQLLKDIQSENMKPYFKSGRVIHGELRQEIDNKSVTDPTIKEKYNTSSKFLTLKDQLFENWDANVIEGTNFVASAGPKDKLDFEDFLESALLNPKQPIEHIVVLAAHLQCDDWKYYGNSDCYEYFVIEGEQKLENYNVSITNKNVNEKPIYTKDESGICNPTKSVIESELLITGKGEHSNFSKKIDVTFLHLSDKDSLNLSTNDSDETKEAILKIYQKSLEDPTLIHCASGIGRTGHLILTLELLRNYQQIQSHWDPIIPTSDILKRIRLNRPCLVQTDAQILEAVRNADILYRYALEKGYQINATPKKDAINKINISVPLGETVADSKSSNANTSSINNLLQKANPSNNSNNNINNMAPANTFDDKMQNLLQDLQNDMDDLKASMNMRSEPKEYNQAKLLLTLEAWIESTHKYINNPNEKTALENSQNLEAYRAYADKFKNEIANDKDATKKVKNTISANAEAIAKADSLITNNNENQVKFTRK